jgi:hypothetical protein
MGWVLVCTWSPKSEPHISIEHLLNYKLVTIIMSFQFWYHVIQILVYDPQSHHLWMQMVYLNWERLSNFCPQKNCGFLKHTRRTYLRTRVQNRYLKTEVWRFNVKLVGLHIITHFAAHWKYQGYNEMSTLVADWVLVHFGPLRPDTKMLPLQNGNLNWHQTSVSWQCHAWVSSLGEKGPPMYGGRFNVQQHVTQHPPMHHPLETWYDGVVNDTQLSNLSYKPFLLLPCFPN